jgi:hypothetical protein
MRWPSSGEGDEMKKTRIIQYADCFSECDYNCFNCPIYLSCCVEVEDDSPDDPTANEQLAIWCNIGANINKKQEGE